MSRIEKIIPVPMNMYVALGDCGHAVQTSTFRGVIGQVGDEVECPICKEQEEKE